MQPNMVSQADIARSLRVDTLTVRKAADALGVAPTVLPDMRIGYSRKQWGDIHRAIVRQWRTDGMFRRKED